MFHPLLLFRWLYVEDFRVALEEPLAIKNWSLTENLVREHYATETEVFPPPPLSSSSLQNYNKLFAENKKLSIAY